MPKSSPPRLLVAPASLIPGELLLDDAQHHHLTAVLRLRPGAAVEAFDGAGRRAVGVLLAGGRRARLQAPEAAAEPPPRLEVLVGLPSPERCDYLMEKLVELGAAAILPVHCERSQGGGRKEALLRRQARWQRLAEAAARQSQRLCMPRIEPLQPLHRAAAATDATVSGFVAQAGGGPPPPPAAAPRCRLVIGPPGGLTAEELRLLAERGYHSLGLGPYVLRSETAALCATSLLLHRG